MFTKVDARDLINDLFEDEALVIGGLVAVHKMDDDLVWRLMKNLDVIRGRFLRRIEEIPQADTERESRLSPDLKPHPAIEDFLISLRRS